MFSFDDKKIFKIVLTGGPCAGKSTIFDELEKHLLELGYYVITVPETATELIKRKMPPIFETKEQVLMFQSLVLQHQYIKECGAQAYANEISKKQKVVILYDRGILDNRAYLDSQEDFNYILKEQNLNEFDILNNYDLVIDLISTATCKPESYELNGIRYETVEEASLLDSKTTTAWCHHSNLKIVKPTDNIEDKKEIVLNEVDKYLNGFEYNNKYIYKLDSNSDLSVYNIDNSKTIDIYNLYLENGLILIQKRYQDQSIFILKKHYKGDIEKVINQCEFVDLISNNKVLYIERFKEITFSEKGNVYKIIENNNNLYLEFEKENVFEIPKNLYKESNQSFVKIKKYDTI